MQKMTPKKPDLVIWDWDGTIVNSIPLIFAAHNHVRTQLGYDAWSFLEFQKVAHKSSRDAYPALYGNRCDDAFLLLSEYLEAHHLDVELCSDAKEALQALALLNVPMIIVSNKTHKFLLKEVKYFGLGVYFSSVLGASEAEHDKPDQRAVEHALKMAGIDVSSINSAWLIGDSQTDVDCAKNLPFETVSYIVGAQETVGESARFDTLSAFLKFSQEY
ncbi:MAG: HAD family hydrolase [Alphaproteobacteria bacterium]|nr:HAD family hydrolase [Alphaproteobacteria bacterium]